MYSPKCGSPPHTISCGADSPQLPGVLPLVQKFSSAVKELDRFANMVMEIKAFADSMLQTGALASIEQLVECHNKMLKSTHALPESTVSNNLAKFTSQTLPSDLSSTFPVLSMTDTQQGNVQCRPSTVSSSSSSSMVNNRKPLVDVDENQEITRKAQTLPGIKGDDTKKDRYSNHAQKVCDEHPEALVNRNTLDASLWDIPETLMTCTSIHTQQGAKLADVSSASVLPITPQTGCKKQSALLDESGWDLPPGLLPEGTASAPIYETKKLVDPPMKVVQSIEQALDTMLPSTEKTLSDHSLESRIKDAAMALHSTLKDVVEVQSTIKVVEAMDAGWISSQSNPEEQIPSSGGNVIDPRSSIQEASLIQTPEVIKDCIAGEEAFQDNHGNGSALPSKKPLATAGYQPETGRVAVNIHRCESRSQSTEEGEHHSKFPVNSSDESQDGPVQGPGGNQGVVSKSVPRTEPVRPCDVGDKNVQRTNSKESELEQGYVNNHPPQTKEHYSKCGWGPGPAKSDTFIARCGWTPSKTSTDHRKSERIQYQSNPVQELRQSAAGKTNSSWPTCKNSMQDSDTGERSRCNQRYGCPEGTWKGIGKGFQGEGGYGGEENDTVSNGWEWRGCRAPDRGGRGGQMPGRGYSSRQHRGGNDEWAPHS